VSTDASRSDATTADSGAQGGLGQRAARTRQAILDASRQLFLDRGYAGTRINNITDACGISRAGFYTYFQDKREVFNVLGETAYREILEVVGAWEKMPRPCSRSDVEDWVRRYFAFMDRHGAFILSAQSKAPDEDIRAKSGRMQMRVWFLLGVNLRSRQHTPTDAPEALGLTIMAMLDRSWYLCHAGDLPVDDTDVVHTITMTIMNVLDA